MNCFGPDVDTVHELRLLHTLKGKIIKWECSCGKSGDEKKTWKQHIEKVTVLDRERS
jgi:hypothetical protein